MTNHIFRVNLSPEARDFQAIATEPGLAMLDRAGVNDSTLRTWFGPLVVHPQWQGDSVYFELFDKDGARLSKLVCFPATEHDLSGPLKEDLAEIEKKLKRIQPTNDSERRLLEIIKRNFQHNAANLEHGDHECFFFRWRRNEGTDPWHLAWAWGYQRRDHKAASGLICTNPACRQLFVQRQGESSECPHCKTVVPPTVDAVQPINWKRYLALAALLLLLLGLVGAGGFLWMNPALHVTPVQWAGPAGSEVPYQVTARRLFVPFFDQDVTKAAKAISNDRRILEFPSTGLVALAKAPGKTTVRLQYNGREATAAVDVKKPAPPKSMRLEPTEAKVAVGATLPLKAVAVFADGKEQDVTDKVTWQVADEAVAFADEATLEGATPGATTLTAQYQAYPDDPITEATLPVEVTAAKFVKLSASVAPNSIGAGANATPGEIVIEAEDENGEKHTLTASPLVQFSLDPPERARVKDQRYLVGEAAGDGKLTVKLNDLEQTLDFTVTAPANAGEFAVRPDTVRLTVSERFPLEVQAAKPSDVSAASSNPEVVRVDSDHNLVGLKPGQADVTLSFEGKEQKVKVEVTDAEFASLRFDPPNATLRVGREEPVRVIGVTKDGDEVPLASDRVEWVRQPPATHVRFDRDRMTLTGLQPTGAPQSLAVRYKDLEAEADVRVIRNPLESDLAVEEFLAYPPLGVRDLTTGRVVERETTPGSETLTVREPATQTNSNSTTIIENNGGGTNTTTTTTVTEEVIKDTPLGDLAIVRDTNTGKHTVTVITTREGTSLGNAGVTEHTVIESIGDESLAGKTREEVVRIVERSSSNPESRVVIREQETGSRVTVESDGTRQRKVNPQLELKAERVQPFEVTQNRFRGRVTAQVLREAEYRVTDEEGKPLSGWKKLGANTEATFSTRTVDRKPGDNYVWRLERRMSPRDEVDRSVNVPFILSPEQAQQPRPQRGGGGDR